MSLSTADIFYAAGTRRKTLQDRRPVKRGALLALAIVGPLIGGGCSNPYDPMQRALAGGMIGAGAGAAAGGMAAGPVGLGIGAGVGDCTRGGRCGGINSPSTSTASTSGDAVNREESKRATNA